MQGSTPKPLKWEEAALPAMATQHHDLRGKAGAGLEAEAREAPAPREAPFLPPRSDNVESKDACRCDCCERQESDFSIVSFAFDFTIDTTRFFEMIFLEHKKVHFKFSD